jgi:hypothetical protein
MYFKTLSVFRITLNGMLQLLLHLLLVYTLLNLIFLLHNQFT